MDKAQYPSQYPPQYGPNGPYGGGPPGMQGAPSVQPGFAVPPPAPGPPIKESWFANSQRNKPQSNSAGSASLILISGGMNLSWSFNVLSYAGYNMVSGMRLSWFIAAAFGALLSAILVHKIPKKIILLFSALLVTIAGILFVSVTNNFDAIIAARCLDGLATGFTIVPSLMLVGEQCVKGIRGMNAGSLDMMCFSLGIFIEMVYRSVWTFSINSTFNANQMHGLLMILYGVLAAVIIQLLMVESPVFLLTQDRESEALDVLRRLQRPFTVTQETYEQLLEHKNYVAANNAMSVGEAAVVGLPALVKLCFYRGMNAMSYSMFMHTAFVTSSFLVTLTIPSLSAPVLIVSTQWPMILFGTFRWLAVMIAALSLDTAGRRYPIIIGSLIAGGMAIGVGVCFGGFSLTSNSMTVAVGLLSAYQFFAGISLVPCSAYLTEAFPLAVKSYYIAAAFIFEMILQIILVAVSITFSALESYFYVLAALSFVLCLVGVFGMPETKNISLREAQDKFRNLLNRN